MKKDIGMALAEFVYNLKYEDIPDNIKEKGKTCLANAICIGVSGYELGPATHARNVGKLFDTTDSEKSATLYMDGSKLSLQGAVLANVVMFHSRAQEDTLGGVHNGTMIVPAALAIAENYPCTGKDILAAIVSGYEVVAVLENKMAKFSTPAGFRPSAVFVPFGVVAAAAKLMKLNMEQIADSIRIVASLVGGIQESFAAGTTEWFYQNACMARNGILAALLAEDGVEGAVSAFDGYKGFMNVFAGQNDYELVREGLENLGKDYRMKNVSFKFNPCCMIAQTPFILTCSLANEKDIDYKQVETIDYHMNSFDSNYPGTKGKGPFTTDTQTTMSAAFNISNAIVNRRCTKKSMQVFDDERILGLVAKTNIVDDDYYPILSGKVVIKMKDGTVYEKEMMINSDYYQLSWAENAEMLTNVHDEVGIDPEKTRRILEIIKDFDKAENADELIAQIARP